MSFNNVEENFGFGIHEIEKICIKVACGDDVLVVGGGITTIPPDGCVCF